MLKVDTRDITKRIIRCIMALVLAVTVIPAMPQQIYAADAFETSIAGFPESYKPYLRALHAKYPAWTFEPYNTGIDFSTAVSNETAQSKSLLEKSYSDYLKSRATSDYNAATGTYIAKDGTTWISASKNTVAYFMDPRNFLNDSYITMFEQLSYNSGIHTQEGVEAILSGSFMYKTKISYINTSGEYKTTNVLYSKRIMDAAKASNVSPYYLASKILLEVGKTKNTKNPGMGAGNSVNGEYPGYTGIYNFYNIGANDGANAVANGLKWASTGTTYRRPWNLPGNSIIGGAEYIGKQYINCGQDTSYFQRFNVKKDTGYALYSHQYMTSIYGCASESASTAAAYKSLGIMGNAKKFVIPVYLNMPSHTTLVTVGSTIKSGTANANVNMRKGPSTSYDKIITLSTGDSVKILQGVMTDELYSVKWLNNPYWYKIQVTKSGVTYTGYVSANYVDVASELTIIKDISQNLNASVSNNETVYYETDNPAIAMVDASGNVTGQKNGTTTIRVYAQGGSFSVCRVTVQEKGAVLDAKSISLKVGESKTLNATVYPLNSTNKTVTWSSSNTAVATVSSTGKVIAKASGTAVISAKAAVGGAVAQCTVKVIKPVTGVSLNKKTASVAVGSKITISAVVAPSDATTKTVTWKSSNQNIAKVADGVVTGVSAGQATITVTTKDGGKQASCTVTVKPAKTTIKKVTSSGYKSARVTWNAVSGVTGYKIYRKTANGKYKLLANVSADKTAYRDTGLITGTRYAYKIAAYKVVGSKTYVAARSLGKAVTVIPAKPKITSVKKSGSQSAGINWKAVNGATGYCVYRRDGKTGSLQLRKTITSAAQLSYTDSNLKTGITYYYRIKAYRTVKGKKIYSKYSKAVSITR